MKSKYLCKVLILFCALSAVGCANFNATGSEAAASETAMTAPVEAKELTESKPDQKTTAVSFEDVMSAEHMPVEEAYESLKDVVPAEPSGASDTEQQAFVQRLKDLMDCSGKFANTTESGNRYSADVSFYLSSGKIYSAVDYSGYRGEIKDGEVVETSEEGYLFMSEPKGDLYGREQDFHLYFGKEYLHIMWADTCDYILDRGDGSAESVEDYKVPFEQRESYKRITELLDKNFPDTEHSVVYDEKNRELNLYFKGPDNLRAALDTKDSKLMESWKGIVETMQTFSETLLTIVKIGGDVFHVNIYWVDRLNSSNEYSDSDYIVWVRDGIVKYNYADEAGKGAGSTGSGASDRSDSSNGSGTFTNAYGTPATICAHPGCNNTIAPSGDTNCCTVHSNRCADCGKYIDEDAMYCLDCLTKAADGSASKGAPQPGNSSSKKSGKKCAFKENGVEVCNNEAENGSPYCNYHKKYLDDAYNSLIGH